MASDDSEKKICGNSVRKTGHFKKRSLFQSFFVSSNSQAKYEENASNRFQQVKIMLN